MDGYPDSYPYGIGPGWLAPRQAAAVLGVTTTTLRRWEAAGSHGVIVRRDSIGRRWYSREWVRRAGEALATAEGARAALAEIRAEMALARLRGAGLT